MITDDRTSVTNGSINLDSLAKDGRFSLSIDPPEDENDARFRRWREFILFCFAILATTIFLGICTWIIIDSSANATDRKWATALVTSTISALVGFLVGRKSG